MKWIWQKIANNDLFDIKPNQTKPNQTRPDQTKDSCAQNQLNSTWKELAN